MKSLIISWLVFSSAFTLLLAVYVSERLKASGSRQCCMLMVSIALYSAGYAIELNQTTIEGIYNALRIEYLGIAGLPLFWLLMAMQYTGFRQKPGKALTLFLSIFPLITLILLYTNDYHHLYYGSVDISEVGPFHIASISKGIWYHLNIAYTNILVLTGNILFFRMTAKSTGFHRNQAMTMFVTSLIPWAGNIFYQMGLSPYGIDLNPFFLTVTGPLFALALFRYRLFDITPIAKEMVFEGMKDPVVVLDNHNRLVDINRAARVLFDLEEMDVTGASIYELISGFGEICSQIRRGCDSRVEIKNERDGFTEYYSSILTAIVSGQDRQIGNILSLQNITGEKRLIKRLHTMATTDELTGLYNRRIFMDLCVKELKRSQRYRKNFSLLIIDIDHFKLVNDRYGHQAGDMVLRETAACLKRNLRASDMLGRYGGEEFVILLPETGNEWARSIALRHNRSVADLEFSVDEEIVRITVSIGISSLNETSGPESIESMFTKADKALYFAKENGRDMVVEYDEIDSN